MKEYDFNPYNFPPELLRAIGLVIACSVQTEKIIEEMIAAGAGIDVEYGGAITTHMNMPLRLSALRSLAEIRIDDLDALDELDELVVEAEKAFERRNEIAHQQRERDPEAAQMILVKEKARISYQADLVPMTADQVEAEALRMYEIGMRCRRG